VKRLTAVNSSSLKLAGVLLALEALLFFVQPRWDAVLRWQLDGSFKTITGYVLLATMALMWAPVWVRKHLQQAHHLEILKLVHQWMGVLVLLVFLLHANLARSGYLAVLSLVLLAGSGLGTVLGWLQLTGRANGRRWLMAAHIALGAVVSGFSLLHLYFVYAYAG
jgi:hypothetical protein